MKSVLEYLRECGVFFLAAWDGTRPHAEPLSAACEAEGHLFIAVPADAALCRWLAAHPAAEIAAVHPDKSRLTIAGRFVEDRRSEARRAMEESARDQLSAVRVKETEDFAVFRVEGGRASLRGLGGERTEWDLP